MTASRPRGRRPGETKTRDAILAAARARFARTGFDRTTIREIARDADVDPALVMHFFASKEQVFVAAMDLPFAAEPAIEELLAGERDRIGEGLMRLFFRIWEGDETGPGMIGLLRSAATHERAAERLGELLDRRIIRPLAAALGTSEPRLRGDLVSAQLVGLGFARYVLRLEPLASAQPEALVAALGPGLQRYLTEAGLFNSS